MNEIDTYLKNATPSQKEYLEHIRSKIKELVPDAIEVMSYGIPTFRLNGKNLIHYAFFKDHMSLFPGSGPIADLEDKLQNYKLSKGTIQFTEENNVPDNLLEEIVLLAKERIIKK